MSADEANRRTSALGLGPLKDIEVLGRGVSGRVTAIRIVGEKGRATIHRELPVRKLFGNLNSGMFTVAAERDSEGKLIAFEFKGGGWGHGVGMCQVGAIGMAEHGHDYKAILRHYYNGASVIRLYDGVDAAEGDAAPQKR